MSFCLQPLGAHPQGSLSIKVGGPHCTESKVTDPPPGRPGRSPAAEKAKPLQPHRSKPALDVTERCPTQSAPGEAGDTGTDCGARGAPLAAPEASEVRLPGFSLNPAPSLLCHGHRCRTCLTGADRLAETTPVTCIESCLAERVVSGQYSRAAVILLGLYSAEERPFPGEAPALDKVPPLCLLLPLRS